MFDMDAAVAALNKAKIALMSKKDSVFFTDTCFSLKLIWDETIPTACTNGLEIRFNPTFFMKQDVEERVFLMLHETMHVAYLHMLRLNNRDPLRWNIAADHVINLQLIERGFKMPKGGLANKKYAGLSTEKVYQLLEEEEEEPPEDFEPDIQECPTPSDELREQVEDILVRAATHSKQAGDAIGTIPGELQVYLDKLLNPVLPWNRILQKYLNSLAKSDYSFRRPNRRYFPEMYLPSLYSEKLIDLEIAVDISGSVTDHEFHVFVSEVASIFKMMKPEKITLVQFDTEIKSVTEIKSIKELLAINFKGRGGTFIVPVIERINAVKPRLVMIFTDGHFKFYGSAPVVKPIWLIHNNPEFTAPYGKVIHYTIKE